MKSVFISGRLIGLLIVGLIVGLCLSPPRLFFLYVGAILVAGGYLLLTTAAWFAIMLISLGCGSLAYGVWMNLRGVGNE